MNEAPLMCGEVMLKSIVDILSGGMRSVRFAGFIVKVGGARTKAVTFNGTDERLARESVSLFGVMLELCTLKRLRVEFNTEYMHGKVERYCDEP